MPKKKNSKEGSSPSSQGQIGEGAQVANASTRPSPTGTHSDAKRPKRIRGKLSQEKHESTVTDSQARERKLEADTQKAFIGFTVMDIVSPPFPETEFKFGAINERPVVEKAVAELLRSFREDGKMPEKATIAVGVEKAWIGDKSTSKTELAWSEVPRLVWTQAAKGATVRFFGGRHRMKACIMWAKVLEEEKATVSNKLERLRKSGERGTSNNEETIIMMEDWLTRLNAAILDAKLWVCRIYIISNLSDECQLHLSKNETHPSRLATQDEKMFMSRLVLLNAMSAWRANDLLAIPPAHGTKKWREEIYNVAFSEAERRAPYMFMFTNPHAFKILGAVCSFSYLRNGRTITLKTLSRALRPISRASHSTPVPAAGFLWGWTILRGREDLALIASAVQFPPIGLEVDGDGRVLQLAAMLVEEDDLPHDVGVIQVYEGYKDLRERWTSRENVRDAVWSGTILDAVDEEYVRHFRPGPALNQFGDDEASEWMDALQQYKATVTDLLGIIWKDKLQATNLVTAYETRSPDAMALENAPDKLAWVWRIRDAGGTCQMPFVTKSFLQDLLSRLEDCTLGFEWLVRTLDGLCDSEIRLVEHPTFDYVSHMVELLSCERLFTPGDAKEDKICAWLVDRLPLLAEVSVLLAEITTQEMRTFYALTPNRWREKIVRGHVAVGHTPEDFPHELRVLMPSFQWSDQDRADVVAAAQWIKRAWAVKQDTDDDDALGDSLCKSIPHLSPDVVKKVPGLGMVYRTLRSWWKEDPRSVPEEAWTYAYQCVIGFKLWKETSGRILNHPSAMMLRDELGEYLSMWAQPSCRTACEGQSDGKWVFWDSLALDRTIAHGKELGLPACRVQRRGWLERRRQERQEGHCKEVDNLVQSVRKLKCAKGEGGYLHPWVRQALQELCQALFDNADRIECAEGHQSARPYVTRETRTAQFNIETLDLGPDDEQDVGAFRTMDDFATQDPTRYAEFKIRANVGAYNKHRDVDALRPQDYDWDVPCPSHHSDTAESSDSTSSQDDQESRPESETRGSSSSGGGQHDAAGGRMSNMDDEDDEEVGSRKGHGTGSDKQDDISSDEERGLSSRPTHDAGSSQVSEMEDENKLGVGINHKRGGNQQDDCGGGEEPAPRSRARRQARGSSSASDIDDDDDEPGVGIARVRTLRGNVSDNSHRHEPASSSPSWGNRRGGEVSDMDDDDGPGVGIANVPASGGNDFDRCSGDEPAPSSPAQNDTRSGLGFVAIQNALDEGMVMAVNKHQGCVLFKSSMLHSPAVDVYTPTVDPSVGPLGPRKPPLARPRFRRDQLRIEPVADQAHLNRSPQINESDNLSGTDNGRKDGRLYTTDGSAPREKSGTEYQHQDIHAMEIDDIHSQSGMLMRVDKDMRLPPSPISTPSLLVPDDLDQQTTNGSETVAASTECARTVLVSEDTIPTQSDVGADFGRAVQQDMPFGDPEAAGLNLHNMSSGGPKKQAKTIESNVNEHILKRREGAAKPTSTLPPAKKRKTEHNTLSSFHFHDDLPGSSAEQSQVMTAERQRGRRIPRSVKASGFTKQELKEFELL